MKLRNNNLMVCIITLTINYVSLAIDKDNRYQVIIERNPFGAELISPDPSASIMQNEAAAMAAANAAEKELRLCFIFETDSGVIRAGFENKTAKSGESKSIMLGVGESFRGMRLLDVNIQNSTATLDRNGVSIMFSLRKATTSINKNTITSKRKFNTGFRETKSIENKVVKTEEVVLSPAQQAKRREEIQENLRQYQMDVIRAGLPPLPVPLTKQMDEQLVAEGILPPE